PHVSELTKMSKPHLPSWSWTQLAWMRRRSSNSSGVSLRGLATGLPPDPSERQGRVGKDRKQCPAGRRGTDKKEHQELGSVAREQSEEHPARGSDAGVQQPAVRLAPPKHGVPSLPPRGGAELRIDQHPEAATPRPSPEEKLSAVRRAAQGH